MSTYVDAAGPGCVQQSARRLAKHDRISFEVRRPAGDVEFAEILCVVACKKIGFIIMKSHTK